MHQNKYRPLLASCVLAAAAFGSIGAAFAESRLEARYSATLAGIPIGSGSWTIEAAETQYTATVNGSTSGLLRAFTGGQGNATARTTLNGGKILSSIYAATITTRKHTDSIRITINNGNVKDFRIDPPQDQDPERLPITEAHQHNVLDPMDCVEVCPVDCFYEGENMLVIHPDECIDCGVCEPECPVDAIKPDTESGLEKWLELNAEYSKTWANITVKKEAPPDAKDWEGVPDKFKKFFSPNAGTGD